MKTFWISLFVIVCGLVNILLGSWILNYILKFVEFIVREVSISDDFTINGKLEVAVSVSAILYGITTLCGRKTVKKSVSLETAIISFLGVALTKILTVLILSIVYCLIS